MLSIITSYLIQTGKCALPYIGFFNSDYKSATTDIVNRQILPPVEEIAFGEETIHLFPGLIKYIAFKRNIPQIDAAEQLDAFCKEWKQKIDNGEALHLETLGILQKDESGKIIFSPETFYSYYNPVHAEQVLHLNAEHAVLVGDTQTTSAAMDKYYNAEPVIEKQTWHMWALVLFAVALILLVYSFYNHKFTPSSVGNRNVLIIKNAGETYSIP